MSASTQDSTLPFFYNFPPYFTLQPVKDTRERQIQLWKQFILDHTKAKKIFIVDVDSFPLFSNPTIDRRLSHEARELFLNALVADGKAEWVDKGHKKCLILWRSMEDWAATILNFVREAGLTDSVMTVEEIRSGDETRGTELERVEPVVLYRALKLLEQRGKAALFKGAAGDDDGVKFFS
eukprot:TRINITY_DN13466_c0_g1_i1.p1 TRINITY_DN13466_c0_g1~~TRINITY_DN13466_c0_g1_i1.p1  ORF type:complete len:180 (+),score=51.86 TRINITY_DN13466_c0_g1_i1:161-700(+)